MATSQILAQGVLPTSKGTLFTGSGQTAVTSIAVTNVDGSARTVNIYFKKSGGTSRHVGGKDVSIASKAAMEFCPDPQAYRMGTGDLIEGDIDSTTNGEYTIFGVVL